MADIGDPASEADPTLPYFSTNPTDPDVHHLFSDCPSGQQIPPENRGGHQRLATLRSLPAASSCRRLAAGCPSQRHDADRTRSQKYEHGRLRPRWCGSEGGDGGVAEPGP